ncbi:MAG: lysophospholipid acyltransferase family protein [Candidatus Hydrogenedentes bacterium]|nr:lysophospholipid acyltransferase family protein [Candidatus Hydrogenedentota bacterium]
MRISEDIPYESPYSFSIPQKVALSTLPTLLYYFLRGLFSLCEWRIYDKEFFTYTLEIEKKVIIAFWHEHMAFGAHIFQGTNYHTLTSFSYDGELASRVVRKFGLETVRGSSSKGGSDALRGLQIALEKTGCVGWTLDGPKGPRRIAKPGVAVLSARAQAPIIPMGAVVDKTWRLNSWDRFPIPKPGAKITVAFGKPIKPPSSEDPVEVEAVRKEVEDSLNNLIFRIQKAVGVKD